MKILLENKIEERLIRQGSISIEELRRIIDTYELDRDIDVMVLSDLVLSD